MQERGAVIDKEMEKLTVIETEENQRWVCMRMMRWNYYDNDEENNDESNRHDDNDIVIKMASAVMTTNL